MEENKQIFIEDDSEMMNYLKEQTKINDEILNNEALIVDNTNIDSIRDSMQIPDNIDESKVSRPELSEMRENLNFTFDPDILNFIPARKSKTNTQASTQKIKKLKKKRNRIANKSKRNNR